MKKLLALLLTLVIALGLGVPVVAQDIERTYNWHWLSLYVVQISPNNPSVPHGEDIVLMLELALPESYKAQVRWDIWVNVPGAVGQLPFGEGEQIRLAADHRFYPDRPFRSTQMRFQAEIRVYCDNETLLFTHHERFDVTVTHGRSTFRSMMSVVTLIVGAPIALVLGILFGFLLHALGLFMILVGATGGAWGPTGPFFLIFGLPIGIFNAFAWLFGWVYG